MLQGRTVVGFIHFSYDLLLSVADINHFIIIVKSILIKNVEQKQKPS